jgi:hypothetical protein
MCALLMMQVAVMVLIKQQRLRQFGTRQLVYAGAEGSGWLVA